MFPARWQQIEELCESALRVEPADRGAFLAQACAGNEALRREVESLLACEAGAEQFMQVPALELLRGGQHPAPERLPAGLQIGPYRVVAWLGGGGMGEVYQARDPRLERDVALKFLPADSSGDPKALERFKREARAASALNHPHICTLYDIGEHEGRPFLVLELLEGESLKERLAAGALPPAEVLALAIQISDALEEAHSKGIVHRDIKPANVCITRRGEAKILDFGVAKLLGERRVPEREPGATAQAVPAGPETITMHGIAMGTVAYMSPEQARREEVDARTDLFSFGATLYQMATGRLPFQEASAELTLEAILRKQPLKPRESNPRLPPELERIILKALEKDRALRYQSASEMKAELDRLKRASEPARKPARRWMLAAAVVAIAIPLYLLRRQGAPAEAPSTVRSVAVLPLANASGDPQQEYLADGLTDALTGSLGRISALRVISRASAMQYKATKKPLSEIAQELKVDAVLRGSVARFGYRVRVSVQLIHIPGNRQLWAETYERDLSDVPTWQSEVVSAVVREVKLKVTPAEAARLAGARPVNRDAFEDYLRGRHWLSKRTEEAIRKAIDHFRRAIDEDPAYAPAYAGLADCYNQLGTVLIGSQPPSQTRPLAVAAAAKALEIDSELAEAHAALGFAKLYDWNWSGAEQSLRRAIELNPSYAPVRIWHASYLICTGRTEEAIREAGRARELDPLSPIVTTQVGWILHHARRYDEAIQHYLRVLETDPNFLWALWQLGQAYTYMSRFDEAIRTLEKAAALSGRSPAVLGMLAYAYGSARRSAEARKLVTELTELSQRRYVPPASVAWAYFGVGDSDQGFAWLEKAYQERSNALAYLPASPVLDLVHSDPRYQSLLRRIGLAE